MVAKEVKLSGDGIYLSMQERPEELADPNAKMVMVGNLVKDGRIDMESITFLPMWAIREIACWYTRHIGPMTVQRCSGTPDCGTDVTGMIR